MFFFFKQKTAYEMRISDWSSDVCSSDLGRNKGGGVGRRPLPGDIRPQGQSRPAPRPFTEEGAFPQVEEPPQGKRDRAGATSDGRTPGFLLRCGGVGKCAAPESPGAAGPEKRSVGKECVGTWRSRWWPNHKKKKI